MAINYAESWATDLLTILEQETLTSPFVTSNVKWLGAKTFHFTQMSTSGFKAHSRAGGWNTGTFAQTDKPYTVNFDRDIQFLVDKADVDETNETLSIQNITKTFQQTQVAPETDAYFFSKVASEAQKLVGYHTATATTGYTVDNTFTLLKGYLAAGKLRRYRANGALIMYVTSDIMDKLERSKEFTRQINLQTLTNNGMGIETRVTDIDGVPVMEVIDDERFYDKFDFTDGFAPVAHTASVVGSHKINVLIASQQTTYIVPKISSIYYFNPGTHTEGDGYLYQNRQFWDTFVFPNGKNGTVDSVYVDVDTVEVGA